MAFKGFHAGKTAFSQIPEPFFSELLPQIDDLAELKLTLYALWRLAKMSEGFRFLRRVDFQQDEIFMNGLAETRPQALAVLDDALQRAIARGSLLVVQLDLGQGEQDLYFFNTERGRAAVDAIRRGEWRLVADAQLPIELTPARPNIYRLYEDHIGPITPLIAEGLQDAEDDYPCEWIADAFQIAVENNVRNWRYVAAILRRWQEKGRDERTDRRDSEEDRRRYADWED